MNGTEDTYPASKFTSETIIRNTDELATHNDRAYDMFETGAITKAHLSSLLERNAQHLLAWQVLPEEQREAFNNGLLGQ